MEIEHEKVQPPSRRWPVISFAGIVLLLVGLSFIWFYNPFPGVKRGIESLFGKRAVPAHVPRSRAARADSMRAHRNDAVARDSAVKPVATVREWDYFVQIASCPRNPAAQVIANALKRRGVIATTEPGYIRAKRQAYYRVKAGPYPTFARAASVRDSLRGIWHDAFVDSVRFEPYLHAHPTPQVLQPEQGGKAPPRQTAPPATAAAGPAKGFGIRVAAYQNKTTAQSEMATMVKKGYPAFVTSKGTSAGVWFRVYVGPFATRADAEKYVSAIRMRVNSAAYLVDFSAENKK